MCVCVCVCVCKCGMNLYYSINNIHKCIHILICINKKCIISNIYIHCVLKCIYIYIYIFNINIA